MSVSDPALTVSDLSLNFRGMPVFENLNLSVPKGELTVILGPSGSGKSTFLRLLAGLETPSSGTISWKLNVDFSKSFVFQSSTLMPWRTALENVSLPFELGFKDLNLTKNERIEKATAALHSLGLSHFLHFYPHELSGGMKMRVSLARALVTNPDVIFLDEPFAALDEETRETLDESVHSFSKNSRNLFFVTHSLAEASFLADRILIFSSGRPTALEHDLRSPLESIPRNEALRNSSKYLDFSKLLRELTRKK